MIFESAIFESAIFENVLQLFLVGFVVFFVPLVIFGGLALTSIYFSGMSLNEFFYPKRHHYPHLIGDEFDSDDEL